MNETYINEKNFEKIPPFNVLSKLQKEEKTITVTFDV